ncbi:MAG: hypothetical protein JSS64_03565 [Bacteroidetes bacterium]|nr:hypothetical protein [Bacteroidota bacterium]
MQQLVLDKKTARKLYPSASPEFKTMLEETFSKAFFPQSITDRVKSFEDACEVLGYNPNTVLPHPTLTEDSEAIIAFAKLSIIRKALNEGWKPDWNNSSQYKYYPWFDMRGAFSYVSYGWSAGSHVGSRLCFKSRDIAEYAAHQFLDLYRDYFV